MARSVAPVRDFSDTWRRRRAQYESWLAGDDAVLLIAQRDDRAVGYAMVTVEAGPATWDLGERVARERGAEALAVGLAHTNDGALR